MGFYGSCLCIAGYVLVAFAAVLLYFHMECIKEREKDRLARVFRPGETDCADVQWNFAEFGVDFEMDLDAFGFDITEVELGPTSVFAQKAPCAVLKLVDFFIDGFQFSKGSVVSHTVTIHDARKKSPGSFHETGFTLIDLEEDPATTDWRTPSTTNEDADIKKFYAQLEPHIMKLYPQTKRLQWTFNVLRGGLPTSFGKEFGDQPRVVNPHLDYHQNDTARLAFHEDFPAMKGQEAELLMSLGDDDSSKLGVLLGVWKPLRPERVCDFPLAFMDTRTFDNEHQNLNKLHVSLGPSTFHNLNGAVSYSPTQMWYYYSFMTTREVVLFHQYSKDRFFVNPHGSFFNKNCPEGTEKRTSVEIRVALFF